MSARLRLAFLWVSQTARVLADWSLRLVALLTWGGLLRQGEAPDRLGYAWHVGTAVFIAPFILLAPLNGCLCNSLPRRRVLVASSAFTLLVVTAFVVFGGSWMLCLGLVALGAAVYSPARYALLPAASVDTRVPLPRVNGWIEMGGAAAIVGGVALGWWSLGEPAGPGAAAAPVGRVAAVLLALNVLCFLTALPVAFPSDVLRPEPPLRAVAGFFRDCGRVLRERPAISSLLGLAIFQAIVTAGSGALVMHTLAGSTAVERPGELLHALALVMVGAALGCGTAALQGHPLRNLGFVALGATGMPLALGWATAATSAGAALPLMPCLLLGFTGGLVNVPLRSAYLAAVPADARGNAMSVMNTTIYLLTTAVALLMVGLARAGLLAAPSAQLGFLAAVTGVGAVVAWWVLLSPTLQLFTEYAMAPMYRVRTYGPGLGRIPPRGPLIVVANHSAYMDPFWLFKVIPRRVTPMMTSVFYDLPVVNWLMVHAVGAIRVPAGGFRREPPELRDAVNVLRRGGCVLIFPEGMLRRKEERMLRQFGQGVWHILQQLPETPVAVCWIEGGWGSYMSYFNGPPLTNKPIDRRRPIDIAIAEPHPLDPEILADQRATRAYLMRACLECRRYLGLDVPTELEMRKEEERGEEVPGADAPAAG